MAFSHESFEVDHMHTDWDARDKKKGRNAFRQCGLLLEVE